MSKATVGFPVGSGMKLLLIFVAAVSASAQLSLTASWEGDTGTGSPTYKDHPDPNVCVSGTHVLQVTGQNVTGWDRAGTLVAGYPAATPAFLTHAGINVTAYSQENDPRCTFNP